MSHFATLKGSVIKDKAILEKALHNIGLKLQRNATCRYYYGEEMRSNVVRLSNSPYDMYFDSSLNMTYDHYRGYVERQIGSKGYKIVKAYIAEKIKMEAKKKQFSCTCNSRTGNIEIIDPNSSTESKLIVSVSDSGEVKFEASGYKGEACIKKWHEFESAFGEVSTTYKPEYYDVQTSNQVLMGEHYL